MNARSAVIETKAMLNTNKYHRAIIEEGTGQLIHATWPARQGGLLIIYLFFYSLVGLPDNSSILLVEINLQSVYGLPPQNCRLKHPSSLPSKY